MLFIDKGTKMNKFVLIAGGHGPKNIFFRAKSKKMDTKTKGAAKLILKFLLVSGLIATACVSPRFASTVMRLMQKDVACKNKFSKDNSKRFYSAFYYLRKKGMIDVRYEGRQMYISLTKEGKKKAGRFQIDDLKIKKPKKWDNKWRILIFDIQDKQKAKREALRGKLKEMDLYQLQKSVWVYPYDFKKEIVLLREFFGLEDGEMKIIEASKIENDEPLREFYKLN